MITRQGVCSEEKLKFARLGEVWERCPADSRDALSFICQLVSYLESGEIDLSSMFREFSGLPDGVAEPILLLCRWWGLPTPVRAALIEEIRRRWGDRLYSDCPCWLRREHYDVLVRDSGIAPSVVRRLGFRSLTAAQTAFALGVRTAPSSLKIPYPETKGFFRVRFDEAMNRRRYSQRSGTGNHLYLPDRGRLDSANELVITEGEKKSAALYSVGYAALAVSGVWSWCDGSGKAAGRERNPYARPATPRKPVAEFDEVNWKGKKALIIFDGDGVRNAQVRQAGEALRCELRRRGARVALRYVPMVKGIDDFLARLGENRLHNLMRSWGITERGESFWQA